jgi:hypothetical protein
MTPLTFDPVDVHLAKEGPRYLANVRNEGLRFVTLDVLGRFSTGFHGSFAYAEYDADQIIALYEIPDGVEQKTPAKPTQPPSTTSGPLEDRVKAWMDAHPTLRKFDPVRISGSIGIAESLVTRVFRIHAKEWCLVEKIAIKAPTTGTLTDHLFDTEAEAQAGEGWLRDSSDTAFRVADAEFVTVFAKKEYLE